jgi:hypothetical protein
MEEQEAPPAVVPDECAGQAVRDYAPLCARDIDELIADGDERGPGSVGRDPPIPPSPAVTLRRGIDPAEEGLDRWPTAMSLNALAGNDRDIGVIGEQGERSAEVLRREAPAEVIDRRENAFEIGRRGHRSTIPQDRASESRPVQAVALSGQIEARQAR